MPVKKTTAKKTTARGKGATNPRKPAGHGDLIVIGLRRNSSSDLRAQTTLWY